VGIKQTSYHNIVINLAIKDILCADN